VRYYVTLGADSSAQPPTDETIVVDLVELPDATWQARVDGRLVAVDVALIGKQLSVRVGGQVVDLTTQAGPPEMEIGTTECRSRIHVESERRRSAALARGARSGAHENVVRSPMPGRVVRVLVAKGEAVRAGQGLVVLEAMKMENEVRASTTGTVADVHVVQGAAVERNAILVTLA
jgi:glutaconyl-CoA/methylmalonyl-CoA decarboxylase subunit gamma